MVFQRSIVNMSGGEVSLVYMHSATCESYLGVFVLYRSIVHWSGRVHVSSVYVHSAICETY